jgi:phospholipase A1
MLWYRMPEKAFEDDNPTILRYMGVGEISLHKSFSNHSVELTLPISERPGAHLEYSYPWYENYRWFASIHYGYGSSLIEYDQSVQRIAFGITLESFMDPKISN